MKTRCRVFGHEKPIKKPKGSILYVGTSILVRGGVEHTYEVFKQDHFRECSRCNATLSKSTSHYFSLVTTIEVDSHSVGKHPFMKPSDNSTTRFE